MRLVKIDETKPKLMDFNASLDYSITVCLSIGASDFDNSLIPDFLTNINCFLSDFPDYDGNTHGFHCSSEPRAVVYICFETPAVCVIKSEIAMQLIN